MWAVDPQVLKCSFFFILLLLMKHIFMIPYTLYTDIPPHTVTCVVGGTLEDHTSVSVYFTTNHRILFPEQTTFQAAHWLKGGIIF